MIYTMVYTRPWWAAFNATINTTPNIAGRVTAEPSANPLTALNTGLRYAVCRVPVNPPRPVYNRVAVARVLGRVDADVPSTGDAHVIFPPPSKSAARARIGFDSISITLLLDVIAIGGGCIGWNDTYGNDVRSTYASQFNINEIITYTSRTTRRAF